jgi:hypothetical protein
MEEGCYAVLTANATYQDATDSMNSRRVGEELFGAAFLRPDLI